MNINEGKPINFRESSKTYLAEKNLTAAVRKATDQVLSTRRSVVAGISGWERLRDEARRIKYEVLSRLPYYLEMLEINLRRNGFTVHWAADGDEAARLIIDIARMHNVTTIAKGKSMTGEEIDLRGKLRKADLESSETDLGEYIIELSGDSPSHITMPAMHKSRRDIGRLFHDRLEVPYTDIPEELTSAARKVLRPKFLRADMGFTGANFAVAETGTLVIVENEGNGRMTTTLPGLVVTLIGVEKIVPTMADLHPFLNLLSPSATGQRLTVYLNFINNPKADSRGREHHVIFLDNGRSGLLSDPLQRQALSCIRCGACLNTCSVYRRVSGLAYGWTYPGPIGAVLAPAFLGLEKGGDLPFASTLCGACREICPLKIDLPSLLLDWRRRVVAARRPAGEKAVFSLAAVFMSNHLLFRAAGFLARKLPSWLIGRLPGLAAWTRSRSPFEFPEHSFRNLWRKRNRA